MSFACPFVYLLAWMVTCSVNVFVSLRGSLSGASHSTFGPMLNVGLQPSWPLPCRSYAVSAKLRKTVTFLQMVW